MGLQVTATSLGDLFPGGCVAAGVTLWCWSKLNRLLALVFAFCFGGAVASAFALKLVAIAYAPPLEDADRFMLSQGAPSGHAACATVVYGCAAVIFAKVWRGAAALTGLAWCLGVIAVVCVTRLTLRDHTVADVAAGVAVGLAFAALFERAAQAQIKPAPAPRASGLLIVMIVIALLALASGVRISSTKFL
jgi:membrane-associated phospholipid phosphatase